MRGKFQLATAAIGVVWMSGSWGCSSRTRTFPGSAGAGGNTSSTAGTLGAGKSGAGAAGRLNSEGGSIDDGGAAGADGGDSSQGGDLGSGGGAAGTAGLANGGTFSAGGAAGVSTGGAGGISAGGTGGKSTGGTGGTSTGGTPSGGTGGCATACASYQFCATNKCLPTYASTRVLPATDQVSGNGQVKSAVVLTDKPQADVIVQLSGDLTLSDANASMLTTLSGPGYARYTADGKLAWSRSQDTLTSSTAVSRVSEIALVPPSDFALNYVKYDPATGPVAGTYSARLARVNGNSGNRTWEAKYPTTTDASGNWPFVVPRPAQGDFLTLDPVVYYTGGQACRITDNGSSGSVACSGASYAMGAASGADGATAWIWGAPGFDHAAALNPLSPSEWPFTGNPFQFGGEDAFILGIRAASTTVGPWMTEGDYGPVLHLAVLSGGDLAVTAQGGGYMTFNGSQSLLDQTGSVLLRIDAATGQILWRKGLSQTPAAVVAAPGGRIAVLNQPSGSNPSVQLFDAANGAALSTLPVPPTSYPVLAAGQTDLFILGDYSSAVDFDPGATLDKPSSTRGVYISRYSF